MNRSKLFEILYPQYESEKCRYDNLHSRSQETLKVTGIIAAVFGLFIGKEIIKDATCHYETITYLIGTITLVLSVIFAIVATGTKPYRGIVDIKTIANEAEEDNYSEEDLYSIMLANMVDCSSHNNSLMDEGFNWLSKSRITLAIGIALVSTGFIFKTISSLLE